MLTAQNTLVDDYEYICITDPAVAKDAPDFNAKWAQYLDGVGEPPLKNGSQPTVFRMQHIRGTARVRLQESVRRGGNVARDGMSLETFALALRLSVLGAEPLHDASGKIVQLTHERVDGIQVLDEASFALFPTEVIIDVGSRAITRTFPAKKS